MTTHHEVLKRIVKLGLLMMMGASMSACGNSTSWKEEVLLHDGGKIIVERYVDRGGRSEIGQKPPAKEQSVTFTHPITNDRITWKSEFSKDVGMANFKPLLLDIFQGTAYMVTSPVGCLSYNKWGRPNPPYVVFKYQSKEWKRIAIQELPAEIKTPNLIISSPDTNVELLGKSFVKAEDVQKINSSLTQPEYKSILREGIANKNGMSITDCEERVYDNGTWRGKSRPKRIGE